VTQDEATRLMDDIISRSIFNELGNQIEHKLLGITGKIRIQIDLETGHFFNRDALYNSVYARGFSDGFMSALYHL
jgi:hypothetical protein